MYLYLCFYVGIVDSAVGSKTASLCVCVCVLVSRVILALHYNSRESVADVVIFFFPEGVLLANYY